MSKTHDIEAIKRRVSTKPLVKGGANFETHVLTKTNAGYKFKPSTVYAIFCGIFAAVPYSALIFALYHYKQTGSLDFILNNSFAAFIFLIFFCVGNYLLIMFFSPIEFSKPTNTFKKGFECSVLRKTQVRVSLNAIIALQIIGEHVISDDNSYNSFELNLVLKDATRINVVDHGKLSTIIIDADTLSKYLNIPIWHSETKSEN